MTLVIGLIGVTGYGQVHLEQILKLHHSGRVRLGAVTVHGQSGNKAPPRELEGLEIPVYSDYNDMLIAHNGQLDLCCIPTPIHWHGVMSADCMRAGAHVLVEKPLAGSLEECRMLSVVQEETGRIAAVGFQNVYDPSSLQIKEQLLAGVIGPIHRMAAFGLSPRSVKYYERNDWAGRLSLDNRPVLDSPANNAMAHHLQWLLFIGGPSLEESLIPTEIEAELYRANSIEGPDTVNLRLETNGGIDVRFTVSHASDIKVETQVVIEGTQGTLVWRQNGNAELRHNDGRVKTFPIPTHREMQMQIIERVVDYIDTGEGFICTLEHAEMHTRCIVAAHNSTPVVEIPRKYVHMSPSEGAPLHHIAGIQEAIRQSANRDLSFSALGIPWATIPPQRATVPGGPPDWYMSLS